MFNIKSIILVTMLLMLTGCGPLNTEYQLLQTEEGEAIGGGNINEEIAVAKGSIEYVILPQDRLSVLLYRDPEQSSEVSSSELGQDMSEKGILVDSKGVVTLPLIGKVKVSGLNQTQAADTIARRYSKYLNTPSIYVEVLNKRIFVLGEVKNPGVIELDKEKMSLFEALAHAGDVTDSAVRENIIIVSNHTKRGLQMRSVDLTNFKNMKYASLMLRPNDIVYVQPDGWKEFKVKSSNFTAPFETVTKIAAPFVTLKYLGD